MRLIIFFSLLFIIRIYTHPPELRKPTLYKVSRPCNTTCKTTPACTTTCKPSTCRTTCRTTCRPSTCKTTVCRPSTCRTTKCCPSTCKTTTCRTTKCCPGVSCSPAGASDVASASYPQPSDATQSVAEPGNSSPGNAEQSNSSVNVEPSNVSANADATASTPSLTQVSNASVPIPQPPQLLMAPQPAAPITQLAGMEGQTTPWAVMGGHPSQLPLALPPGPQPSPQPPMMANMPPQGQNMGILTQGAFPAATLPLMPTPQFPSQFTPLQSKIAVPPWPQGMAAGAPMPNQPSPIPGQESAQNTVPPGGQLPNQNAPPANGASSQPENSASPVSNLTSLPPSPSSSPP